VPTFASERRWLVLFVLCIAVFLVVVDNTIVNVALPTISRDLHASNSSLQWIVDGYSLPFAGLLLAGGGLSDRLGRKRVMQIGLFAFSVFSLLAAFSHNVSTLLTARALMGASAAFIFPATLSTLTVVFDDRRERAKAFGLWARRPVSPLPLVDRGWRSHHALFFRIDFLGERPDRSRGRRGDRVRGAGVHDPQAPSTRRGGTGARNGGHHGVDPGDHSGSVVGLAFVTDVGALRSSGAAAQRIRQLRVGPRRTALERADLQQPDLLRQRRGHGHQLLLPLRLHLPRDAVLPTRAGYSALSAGIHTLPYAFTVMVATPIGALAALRLGRASWSHWDCW